MDPQHNSTREMLLNSEQAKKFYQKEKNVKYR